MADTRKPVMNESPDSPMADKLDEDAGAGESKEGEFPEVMTIAEAAKYLRVAEQVLYRHVRTGLVPASRVGGTIRFKKSVLDAWLEESAWQSVGRRASAPAGHPSAIDVRGLASPEPAGQERPRAYRRARRQEFSVEED